jgi:hypothetical protein
MTPTMSRRAADQSNWVRTSEFLERYKLLVYLVVTFLLALGFDFKLPGQTMKNMQVQIDELKTTWVEMQSKQDIELRLFCVNGQYTEKDKQLAGLDCVKILGGR